jgi:hypothetical protein
MCWEHSSGLRVLSLWAAVGYHPRHLFGHSPPTAHEFTRHSADLVGIFSAGHQASKAFGQPHLRLPTDIQHGFGWFFEPG